MYEAISDIENKRKNKEQADSYIFFVGRENYPVELEGDGNYKLGKARVLKSGSKGVVVSAGATLFKALEAANQEDLSVVVNPSVNAPDIELIKGELAKNDNKLITVEDHQLIGGMGAQLTHALKLDGCEFKLQSLAVAGEFGRSAYTADQLYNNAGLGVDSIVEKSKQI